VSQVVTELVIDSDTSGADRFSDAMGRAGDAAQSGGNSVVGMTLAIAGVSVAAVVAVAGLRSFVDYVGQQTQQLVDLSDHAQLAGMSLREFQETLYAARAGGVSDKDFFSGIDKISQDLVQAGQQATEFGRLFEANGLKIRVANGQLISTKQALTDIMGLMEGASPAVQQRIAAIAGLSASWIPFLREGVDQFEAMKQKAADLGIIIDDGTVAKAREFNSEWKQAVAAWDLQFKATMASVLPLLVQAADLARTILDGIGSVSGLFGRWLTPTDQQSSSQLNDTINDVYRLREAVEALGGTIDKNGSLRGMQASVLAGSLNLPENASLGQVDELLAKLQSQYDGSAARLRVTPAAQTSTTVLPGAGGKDDVDKVTDAVDRQIAKMQADAEAAGQGAGAIERLRVEAQLYAAAERAGYTDLEQYADRFYALAERAGQAAEALAKAKIAADIRTGQNTAFLGEGDLAVAQKLKDIYPDVATALSSAEAAQLRFNNAARGLSSSIENSLVSGLTDITTGTKTASQGFADLEAAVVKAIEQMIIKITIVEPLMRGLQSAFSGFALGGVPGVNSSGGIVGAVGGTSVGGAPLVGSALGNVFSAGQVIPFASGGVPDIVASPTIAPMAMFGEAGDEGILPLRRGSDGRLGVTAGGIGDAPNVIINNHTDAQPTIDRSPNGDVTVTLRRTMDAATADSLSGGSGRRVLAQQFGLKQFTGQ
jgi:hypothetical protein